MNDAPKHWLDRSIVNRTAFHALALTAAFVVVIGTLSYAFTRHLVQQQIDARLAGQSQQLAERISQNLNAVTTSVTGLASNSLVINALVDSAGRVAYLQPFLRDHSLPIPINYSLALTDFSGQILAKHGTPASDNYTNNALVTNAVKNNASSAALSPSQGEAQLRVVQPVVYPATGFAEGALVLELHLRDILGRSDSEASSDLEMSIISQSGAPLVSANLITGRTLTATQRLELQPPLDHLGLQVQVAMGANAALQPLRELAATYVIVGFFALVIAGFLARKVARTLTAPVVALSASVDRISTEARLDFQLPTSPPDEIATLAESFARMLKRLRDSQIGLETLVDTRTAELQEARKRLQAVFDNVPDGIITIDESGRVLDFNAGAERLFGFSAEEVRDKNINMIMPEPYRSAHDTYLANYVMTNEKHVIGNRRELSAQRSDGSTFPCDLTVTECQIGSRRLFVGLIRDISDRIRIERLKNEFVSTVSHELRTPLTAIRGALGLLIGRVSSQLDEQSLSLLTIADNNSHRLIMLINDILDIEKIESGKMDYRVVPTRLGPLLEQAIMNMKPYGDQLGVRFQLEDRAPDATAAIDSDRLAQVLNNLLSNAAKFSPRGARVSIRLARDSGLIRVEVSDRGPGVPQNFRDKIFQKFSQADSSDTRQKGGTGLGLAISKAIVEHLGGHIDYADNPEGGSIFYFTLPEFNTRKNATLEAELATAD